MRVTRLFIDKTLQPINIFHFNLKLVENFPLAPLANLENFLRFFILIDYKSDESVFYNDLYSCTESFK